MGLTVCLFLMLRRGKPLRLRSRGYTFSISVCLFHTTKVVYVYTQHVEIQPPLRHSMLYLFRLVRPPLPLSEYAGTMFSQPLSPLLVCNGFPSKTNEATPSRLRKPLIAHMQRYQGLDHQALREPLLRTCKGVKAWAIRLNTTHSHELPHLGPPTIDTLKRCGRCVRAS